MTASKAPRDHSNLKPGEVGDLNLPSEEGRLLGEQMARLTDIEEAKQRDRFPDMLPRCNECALRHGTVANQCASTLMDIIKCTVEHDSFYCHKGIPDDGEPKRLCGGFVLLLGSMSLQEQIKRKPIT